MNIKKIIIILLILSIIPLITSSKLNAEKKEFKVAWSIYAGWMPWDYAENSGILKKWADHYGIKIEMVRMDYIPSIEAYVTGQVDGCVMTNMECLDMPAASGIDSTALIINTSDSDIGPIFISNKSSKAVITWNPIVMEIEKTKGISNIFTSADIPEEVLDMMVVNTKTLKNNPALGKALTGAWYEIMDIMTKKDAKATKALTYMAKSAECSLEDYKAQLKATAMFYKAADAVKFVTGKSIKEKMNFVRNFCFRWNNCR